MKYFNETVTNAEKEIDFIRAFVAKIKSILGNRIVLVEQEGKAFIEGNDYDSYSSGYAPGGYGYNLILDNKITISFTRSTTSGAAGYAIKATAISSSSSNSPPYTQSSGLGFKANGTRSLTIKGIKSSNLLIFSIIANASNTSASKPSFNLIVLQNNDTYCAAVRYGSGENPYSPISNNFNPNLIFSELLDLDTLSGQKITLVNRFPYNYNTDISNKQTELRTGKIAVLQNTSTKITNFSDLIDTSYIPQGLFVKINNENYISLNNFTLINIDD